MRKQVIIVEKALILIIIACIIILIVTNVTFFNQSPTFSFFSTIDLINTTKQPEPYNDTKVMLIDEQIFKNNTKAQFFKKNNSFHPSKARILVSPWNVCTNDHGRDLHVFFYIFTRVSNFKYRSTIRQTYTNQARHPKFNFAFLLGASLDVSINLKVRDENEEYGDIIQGDFIDAYRNLSLKSMIAWRWMIHNCQNARYFGKMDDDVFVNTVRFFSFIKNETLFNPPNRSFTGEMLPHYVVIRGNHKFAVSMQDWPGSTFKPYVNGPLYVN
jgi:hypothetical protein